MKILLKNLKADKSGASAAEYALLLALVAVGLITAFNTLATNISTGLTTAGTAISTARPK